MLTCYKLVTFAIVFCFSILSFSAKALAHVIEEANGDPPGSGSIIDILSSSPDFSVLIQHLQRTGLIPLLNEASNITLLSPTNSAFIDVDHDSITKSRLLYHLLNQTLLGSQMGADLVAPTFLDSSHLAHDNHRPDLKQSESYALPVYVSYNTNTEGPHNFSLRVGGIPVIEPDIQASKGHGVVQVVDKLLDIPLSVCDLLESNPQTSIFAKIFQMEFNCSFPMLPSYSTILVPTDEAFAKLNKVEVDYLQSKWGSKDRTALLARHILDSFFASPLIGESGINATAMDGTTLLLSDSLTVNDTAIPVKANILASDAVVHLYDSFMTSTGGIDPLIEFTPKKYIIGLGAHDFLKELQFRNLAHLVNGKTDPQTLFVPISKNDETFFTESASSILYHFVYGKHVLDFNTVLTSNVLLESKSNHKKLGYGNQRIKVVADEKSHSLYLNGRDTIVGDPYEVGNTTIFAIRGSLDTPPTLDLAVGSIFQGSQSAAYLNTLDLLDLPSKKGWTMLLPSTLAWDRLGLVKTYLESNKTALRGVLESLIISRPFYSDSEPMDTKLFSGTNVSVHIRDRSLIMQEGGRYFPNAPFDILLDDSVFRVETPNVLSSNGVVHLVSDIRIPVDIDVNPTNILDSVDAKIFVSLLKARNMSHVLDPKASYTILAPSDQVLQANNVTVDTPDIDTLLRLHLIPNNPIDKFLRDGKSVESLEYGVHLVAKELNSGIYLVSIVEGDKREIRVLSRGDSSVLDEANVTTILYVDRYLSPDWISRPPFAPPFRLKTPVAILLGVVFGAILIFGVLSCGLFVFLGRARASNIANTKFAPRNPIDAENRPLLSHRSSSHLGRRANRSGDFGVIDDSFGGEEGLAPGTNGSMYGSTRGNSRRSSMRSTISEHSISEAIPTARVQKDREHGRHLGLPRV